MLLRGKTVLVTGAGGSIGSEVCRQVTAAGAVLICFDNSEYGLYRISHETGGLPILGDCRDEAQVISVFGRYQPDYVFHVAAYKHVPMLEGENAFVGVRNNVLGTLYTAKHAPSRYVLVSTDKAVNPSCIMGASKRLCEFIAAEHQGVIVRFGNVLDSAGSVVPRFREQIASGGPITVTHPDVERFFMTIPQAAELILKAAAIGRPATIYMLEMGKPVRISDLARRMIAEAGSDAKIVYIGLRPGEKLREEVKYPHERKVTTDHPSLYALHGPMPRISAALSWLGRGFASYSETRGWIFGLLSQCKPHVADRKLAIVQDTRHADAVSDISDGAQMA